MRKDEPAVSLVVTAKGHLPALLACGRGRKDSSLFRVFNVHPRTGLPSGIRRCVVHCCVTGLVNPPSWSVSVVDVPAEAIRYNTFPTPADSQAHLLTSQSQQHLNKLKLSRTTNRLGMTPNRTTQKRRPGSTSLGDPRRPLPSGSHGLGQSHQGLQHSVHSDQQRGPQFACLTSPTPSPVERILTETHSSFLLPCRPGLSVSLVPQGSGILKMCPMAHELELLPHYKCREGLWPGLWYCTA